MADGSRLANYIYTGIGGIIVALMMSAWNYFRPMTKVEHDADFEHVRHVERDVRKLVKQWDCYNTSVAIRALLADPERTEIEDDELRQLRDTRTALECAGPQE